MVSSIRVPQGVRHEWVGQGKGKGEEKGRRGEEKGEGENKEEAP